MTPSGHVVATQPPRSRSGLPNVTREENEPVSETPEMREDLSERNVNLPRGPERTEDWHWGGWDSSIIGLSSENCAGNCY